MTLVQQPIRRRGAHSNRCRRGSLLREFVSAEGLGREGRLRAESPAVARPAGQWAQSAAAARPAGRGARWARLGPWRGARGAGRSAVHPEAEGSAAERAAADSVVSRYTVTAWCDCPEPRPVVVSDFSFLPFCPL